MIDLIYPSVELGLLYSLVVFGVFLTFRTLHFPDLTVDGSFVTGAAAAAIAVKAGLPGLAAVVIGFIAGFAGGSLTAILHNRFGIGKILSGILTLSMLYTINLRIMGGPNISLLNQANIIPWLKSPVDHVQAIAFLIVIVLLIKLAMDWFLQTEFGLFLRATGENEATVQSFGMNTRVTKFVGVALSNGFVGMAGGLMGQYQGFVDVNMGIGIIILGLAALMLGEALLHDSNIAMLTWAVVIGAIVYELIVNIALRLGLPATDLRLITALIVILSLILGSQKGSVYGKRFFGS